MPKVQDLIHKLEVGGGSRWLRLFLAGLVVLAFVVACNWRNHKNLSSQEAMDSAQLARNIAEGKGYTTLFVRPFSISLQKKVNEKKLGTPAVDSRPDYARLRTVHPDVSNPPVYPVTLAAWMKVCSLCGVANPTDFFIGIFNQLIFFAILILTFFWARRFFDNRVAWISAALLLCSNFLWQFSFSGLSTMLLVLLFTVLVWCLTILEKQLREPTWTLQRLLLLAGIIGIVTALGGLTRYAFLWMIVPVLLFVFLFGGAKRVTLGLVVFFAFMMVVTPWLIRNYHLTKLPFGTSTYALFEGIIFPDFRLQRSLHAEVGVGRPIGAFCYKLFSNLREILQNDLPTLGGSWVTALFLVGLLISFLNIAIRRARYFILMSLGTLLIVQALGRTQLSIDSEVFNSENLLVLLVPLVTVYGVSLFFVLLDQMTLPMRELRYGVIGLFWVLVSLPLIFTFLPPKPTPNTYPSYQPMVIQKITDWMKPDELIMSDIPWVVAWYGHRQSVWLTLNARYVEDENKKVSQFDEDFFEINDSLKTVSALYLSPKTMDARFVSEWVMSGARGWGSFLLESVVLNRPPPNFPLTKSPPRQMGFLPNHVFYTDWERWPETETAPPTK